jgi:hypothetical protein
LVHLDKDLKLFTSPSGDPFIETWVAGRLVRDVLVEVSDDHRSITFAKNGILDVDVMFEVKVRLGV